MSKATYPLKLPTSIKKAAQRLTKEDGVCSPICPNTLAYRNRAEAWRRLLPLD